MPRTSVDEMLIRDKVVETPRPDAPYELSDAEAAEWRAIVASMPTNHFSRGNYALLAQLCRHIVSSNMISALIGALRKQRKFEMKELTHLLTLQDRESKTIMNLTRSMRLSQQAVYRGELKSVRPLNAQDGAGTVSNPWEDDE